VRSLLAGPPALPREFWDSAQMRDALETWHMGRVIYAYRTHPWHPRPLSQELAGNWLGLTQVQVGRIEKGRAPEELTKLIAWAKILGIPGDLLWFRLPQPGSGAWASPAGAPAALTLPAILDGRPVLLPIDIGAARAQGLDTLIGQLTGHGQAGPLPGGLPFPVQLPRQPARAVQVLSLDDITELEQLAAALDDARRYLDRTVVGLFRRQLDVSKADDGHRGPAKALPVVLGILGAIEQHVREVKPDVGRLLLSLGADGAEFAGWLYRDLQDTANATFWYDRAMEWAQAASDTAMQGYVLLKKSQMAFEERDVHLVVALAEAACQGPWRLPPAIRAEATQQHAIGLAMAGEPIEAVEQQMSAAREALDQAGPDEQAGSAAYFTADTLLLRQATCYTEAGKPARAAVIFDEVLARGGLSRRDAGFFRARRAAALALSGEPDEAAEVGLKACQTARDTSSERTIRLLAETVHALRPWGGRPGPRALRQAVLANSP
jgi:transcriptional regulator with XRE-family HTH domain/tetratricopeptide (TPR) repeat protein